MNLVTESALINGSSILFYFHYFASRSFALFLAIYTVRAEDGRFKT